MSSILDTIIGFMTVFYHIPIMLIVLFITIKYGFKKQLATTTWLSLLTIYALGLVLINFLLTILYFGFIGYAIFNIILFLPLFYLILKKYSFSLSNIFILIFIPIVIYCVIMFLNSRMLGWYMGIRDLLLGV